jgi:hypothetical protein
MAEDGSILIRSYRVCFDLERRIHKIDRWRIPLPYGVPLSGLGYALGALLAVVVLSKLPVAGVFLSILHPALRYVVLPVAVAMALTRWSLDGRPAHAAGLAWLRLHLEPRRLAGFRAAPAPDPVRLGEIPIAPDEGGAALRKGVVQGPCTLVLRYPMQSRPRGRTLRVGQEPGAALWRGKEIRLNERQRVVFE